MKHTAIILILGSAVLWGCTSLGAIDATTSPASRFTFDSESVAEPRRSELPAWDVAASARPTSVDADAVSPGSARTLQADSPDVATKEPPSTKSRWEFTISPYLWIAQRSGHVSTDLGTVALDDPDESAAFFLYGEANYERWGLAFDVAAMHSDDEADSIGGGKIDLDEDTLIVEADVTYRPLEDSSLQFLAGLRVFDDSLDIDFPILPDQKDDVTQWDPVVGAQGTWELGNHFVFRLRGDIGGFGLDSDLTYQGLALLAWEFLPHWYLSGGYRLLGYKYDDGDNENDWRLDGFLIGLAARF